MRKKAPVVTKLIQELFEKQPKSEHYNVPDICGYKGRACRQIDKIEGANRMPCMCCSLARYAADQNTTMRYYGCTKCQTYHYEDEPIYSVHIDRQSKHGIDYITKAKANKARQLATQNTGPAI